MTSLTQTVTSSSQSGSQDLRRVHRKRPHCASNDVPARKVRRILPKISEVYQVELSNNGVVRTYSLPIRNIPPLTRFTQGRHRPNPPYKPYSHNQSGETTDQSSGTAPSSNKRSSRIAQPLFQIGTVKMQDLSNHAGSTTHVVHVRQTSRHRKVLSHHTAPEMTLFDIRADFCLATTDEKFDLSEAERRVVAQKVIDFSNGRSAPQILSAIQTKSNVSSANSVYVCNRSVAVIMPSQVCAGQKIAHKNSSPFRYINPVKLTQTASEISGVNYANSSAPGKQAGNVLLNLATAHVKCSQFTTINPFPPNYQSPSQITQVGHLQCNSTTTAATSSLVKRMNSTTQNRGPVQTLQARLAQTSTTPASNMGLDFARMHSEAQGSNVNQMHINLPKTCTPSSRCVRISPVHQDMAVAQRVHLGNTAQTQVVYAKFHAGSIQSGCALLNTSTTPNQISHFTQVNQATKTQAAHIKHVQNNLISTSSQTSRFAYVAPATKNDTAFQRSQGNCTNYETLSNVMADEIIETQQDSTTLMDMPAPSVGRVSGTVENVKPEVSNPFGNSTNALIYPRMPQSGTLSRMSEQLGQYIGSVRHPTNRSKPDSNEMFSGVPVQNNIGNLSSCFADLKVPFPSPWAGESIAQCSEYILKSPLVYASDKWENKVDRLIGKSLNITKYNASNIVFNSAHNEIKPQHINEDGVNVASFSFNSQVMPIVAHQAVTECVKQTPSEVNLQHLLREVNKLTVR